MVLGRLDVSSYWSPRRNQNQFKQNSSEDLREYLEVKVEDILQQEMALLRDRDSNLQFKVDRLKHNQERLQKSVGYLFKIQIASIVVTLLFAAYVIFSQLN